MAAIGDGGGKPHVCTTSYGQFVEMQEKVQALEKELEAFKAENAALRDAAAALLAHPIIKDAVEVRTTITGPVWRLAGALARPGEGAAYLAEMKLLRQLAVSSQAEEAASKTLGSVEAESTESKGWGERHREAYGARDAARSNTADLLKEWGEKYGDPE